MNNITPKTVTCDKSKSDLFYNYNNNIKDFSNAPTDDEFSNAVERWLRTRNIESLREYAAAGRDLSSFYKEAHIGKHLSRREITVDQWGTPIVPKYEASLYAGLSEFSASKSFLKKEHEGQLISFRCDSSLEWQDEEADLAKAKNVTRLRAIDRFLLSGADEMAAKSILKHNITLFNAFKNKNQSLCKGVHYLPFSGLAYSDESKDRIISERNRLIKSEILSANNLPYFDIQKLIEELELKKIVDFDACDFNVCLQQNLIFNHSIVLAFIIDTKTSGKPKVTKLVGFNSWSVTGQNDPLASLDNINKFRDPSDPLKIVKIYYGAQIDGKGLLNSDRNCTLYSFNTMNALAKLLTSENTLYHKRFIQGIELTLKERIIAGTKMILSNMIILYILSFVPLFIFNLCINQLSLSTILVIPLLLSTLTAYYLYLFNISNSINAPLKTELQQALPQYFDEKNGQMVAKDFEERKIVLIQDRWLTGNIIIEELIKNASKNSVVLGGKRYTF